MLEIYQLGPLSDWWMLAMVFGIVMIDVVLLVAWELTDPLQHEEAVVDKKVSRQITTRSNKDFSAYILYGISTCREVLVILISGLWNCSIHVLRIFTVWFHVVSVYGHIHKMLYFCNLWRKIQLGSHGLWSFQITVSNYKHYSRSEITRTCSPGEVTWSLVLMINTCIFGFHCRMIQGITSKW